MRMASARKEEGGRRSQNEPSCSSFILPPVKEGGRRSAGGLVAVVSPLRPCRIHRKYRPCAECDTAHPWVLGQAVPGLQTSVRLSGLTLLAARQARKLDLHR